MHSLVILFSRNLQSDRNTIHKNLVLCLLIAELLFLFGIGQTSDKVGLTRPSNQKTLKLITIHVCLFDLCNFYHDVCLMLTQKREYSYVLLQKQKQNVGLFGLLMHG